MLDLFCGAGGAATGYIEAGWTVTGVDIEPQPAYPGAFVQADAILYLAQLLAGPCPFDAIHASPPCQGYSPHVSSASSPHAGTLGRDEPKLIPAVRAALQLLPAPYVIENVVGARDQLRGPVLLCGAMYGLPIPRHRLFETSFKVPAFDVPRHPRCAGIARRYAAERGWDYRDMSVTGKGRHAGTLDRWREAMRWPGYSGTQHGMREAIPPAYTAWLGQLVPS